MPRSVKKGAGGGTPDARAEVSLQPVVMTTLRQAVVRQRVEHPTAEQEDVPEGRRDCAERLRRRHLLAESATPWRRA